jgi:hypothetical protein
MGNDPTNLTNVLLIAVAGGAILAFGFLASQRVIRSASYRVWIGAALIAVPGLILGWMVTQPELGVRSAYGEISQAILGDEPTTTRASTIERPHAAAPSPKQRTTSEPSSSPSSDPPVIVPTIQTAPPPSDTTTSPSPSPSASPSPSPSGTPSETPSPTPSETPSPTPSASPAPDELPPPPPEPPDDDVRHGLG